MPKPTLSHEEQLKLQAKFEALDTNKNGLLERSEVTKCVSEMGMSMTSEEIADMVAEFDTNADGLLSYKEFLGLMS